MAERTIKNNLVTTTAFMMNLHRDDVRTPDAVAAATERQATNNAFATVGTIIYADG